MKIFLSMCFLPLLLFSFTNENFQSLYDKIEKRVHPSFTLLLIADKEGISYIGGRKKERLVHINNAKLNLYERYTIAYLFEPGRALFPLLAAYTHSDFSNFSSNKKIAEAAKGLSLETLHHFFHHFNFTKAAVYKNTLGKHPIIPLSKHQLQKVANTLGYGLLITPMHMLYAYMQGLQEFPSLQKFMLHNATLYYNIFQNNIGVVGTVTQKATNGRYGNRFLLSYYGFVDTNDIRHFIMLLVEFDAPTRYLDSRNFISLFLDIVDTIE